ncbi:MAG: alpha/beta fold hydrolase [Clostridia bacterium]|nr:alpha/beta fold hydrolase [Clostridia bacterium]
MHVPVRQKCKDAKTAVVFIHGLMGSPVQFIDLAAAVYNNGCSCISLLLPGHGGNMKNFARSGIDDWERHVQSELDKIRHDYNQIVLVGHSMGGLLALNASLNKENKIAGAVLISTPFKIHLLNFKSLLRKARLLMLPLSSEIKAAYVKSNSIAKTGIFFYPQIIKPLISLYMLIRKTKKRLPEISVPVYMFYSRNDETTSYRSADILQQGLCNTQRIFFALTKSHHAFYCDEERRIIRDRLIEFIQKIQT